MALTTYLQLLLTVWIGIALCIPLEGESNGSSVSNMTTPTLKTVEETGSTIDLVVSNPSVEVPTATDSPPAQPDSVDEGTLSGAEPTSNSLHYTGSGSVAVVPHVDNNAADTVDVESIDNDEKDAAAKANTTTSATVKKEPLPMESERTPEFDGNKIVPKPNPTEVVESAQAVQNIEETVSTKLVAVAATSSVGEAPNPEQIASTLKSIEVIHYESTEDQKNDNLKLTTQSVEEGIILDTDQLVGAKETEVELPTQTAEPRLGAILQAHGDTETGETTITVEVTTQSSKSNNNIQPVGDLSKSTSTLENESQDVTKTYESQDVTTADNVVVTAAPSVAIEATTSQLQQIDSVLLEGDIGKVIETETITTPESQQQAEDKKEINESVVSEAPAFTSPAVAAATSIVPVVEEEDVEGGEDPDRALSVQARDDSTTQEQHTTVAYNDVKANITSVKPEAEDGALGDEEEKSIDGVVGAVKNQKVVDEQNVDVGGVDNPTESTTKSGDDDAVNDTGFKTLELSEVEDLDEGSGDAHDGVGEGGDHHHDDHSSDHHDGDDHSDHHHDHNVGSSHHKDTHEDKESKKRTAIIVGVAVGGVALFTIAFFTSRQCKNKGDFKAMQKSKDQSDPEAIEFRPVSQTTTAINDTHDPPGAESHNGLYRHGPRMGPPSPRVHRRTSEGAKFQFPETSGDRLSPTASPAIVPLLSESPNNGHEKSGPRLSISSDISDQPIDPAPPVEGSNGLFRQGPRMGPPSPRTHRKAEGKFQFPVAEPLMNGVEKLKYIDDSTDDEGTTTVNTKLLPSKSHDQTLGNVAEESRTPSTSKPDNEATSNGKTAITENGDVPS